MLFPKLEKAKAALKAIFDAAGPDLNIEAVPADLFGDRPCNTVPERVAAIKAMNDELKDLLELQRAANIAGNGESGFDGPGGGGHDFYSAIIAAGYDRRFKPHVEVPWNAATYTGFDGGYDDAMTVRRDTAGLGADQRYLYPSLVYQSVGSDVTSIESFRQVSRTLAAPADMIRAIDASTSKPETDTATELVREALKQIATVESGVKNIMLESSKFRGFIEFDLRQAFSDAIDTHVALQIAAANPPAGVVSPNILEGAVRAAEEVASNGYAPSILAAAPQDLIELLLLREPGNDNYVGSNMAHALDGLKKVAVKGLAMPLVIDPNALGTLYMGPVSLKSFEENAGKTNTSNVRIESNGLYLVQRADAAAEVTIEEVSV